MTIILSNDQNVSIFSAELLVCSSVTDLIRLCHIASNWENINRVLLWSTTSSHWSVQNSLIRNHALILQKPRPFVVAVNKCRKTNTSNFDFSSLVRERQNWALDSYQCSTLERVDCIHCQTVALMLTAPFAVFFQDRQPETQTMQTNHVPQHQNGWTRTW